MLSFLILFIFIFIGWLCYIALIQIPSDDDVIDDPTTTCWHDDDENKNHTEGDF
jgi:hypothetical protein